MNSNPAIRISPPEFQFYASRSSSGYISRLTIRNLIDRPVGFKLKTNAPARYSVKPVLASLAPNAVMEVYVRSDSEVMPEDKFLIQSLPLTPAEAQDKLSSTSWRLLDRRRITENLINCSMMRGFRAHTLSQSSTRSPTPSKFSQLTPPSSPTKLSNENWAQGASEVYNKFQLIIEQVTGY
ncbi:hypothetical protein K450DRAFT_230359 [Umbelopsis ramanniana AG]|uniref:MSP domain-containing protein n=1 Tax=Umbelopsis ramanniana AG TaxID=1314678 RepID=A0AAD5EE26_UMBRA|nr:uncharacterized protein K450DRAFT_230359 [Umbelopsis ramanniana AG]KAI8582008.1 hypothetical protein K450DRAFT_230359 [Umbelopsis ramanniana AG]